MALNPELPVTRCRPAHPECRQSLLPSSLPWSLLQEVWCASRARSPSSPCSPAKGPKYPHCGSHSRSIAPLLLPLPPGCDTFQILPCSFLPLSFFLLRRPPYLSLLRAALIVSSLVTLPAPATSAAFPSTDFFSSSERTGPLRVTCPF